jgi:hypothetical protein
MSNCIKDKQMESLRKKTEINLKVSSQASKKNQLICNHKQEED